MSVRLLVPVSIVEVPRIPVLTQPNADNRNECRLGLGGGRVAGLGKFVEPRLLPVSLRSPCTDNLLAASGDRGARAGSTLATVDLYARTSSLSI